MLAPGSGFAPEIGYERFENLLTVLGLPTPTLPSTAPRLPVSWDAITIGERGLAQADTPADGWWPGIVENIEDEILAIGSTDVPDIAVN